MIEALPFTYLIYRLLGYIPWLIAYDYPHNAIMIVVRGTLTPKDFFTDMISMVLLLLNLLLFLFTPSCSIS